MLTVRLPDDLAAEIDRLASIERRTKSDVVKDALRQYVAAHQSQGSSYELGKELFGVGASGDGSLSKTYKMKLRAKLREKHTH